MVTYFLVPADGRPIAVGVGILLAAAQVHNDDCRDLEGKTCRVVESDVRRKMNTSLDGCSLVEVTEHSLSRPSLMRKRSDTRAVSRGAMSMR
jgi:hypothetical protein